MMVGPLSFPARLARQIENGFRLPVWVLGVALGLRLLLAPLNHTWDSQTWVNVMAQLGGEPDPLRALTLPYESMRRMSDVVRGGGQAQYYEGWAYPPGMLYLWWPLARTWDSVAGPLPETYAGPGVFTARPLPILLSILMKIPVIAADFVVAALLARWTSEAVARWYLLNPYVLLVGLWTFDSVSVAFLLGGLWAAQNRRWTLAGALLGGGALVKFTPAFLAPAVGLWALQQGRAATGNAIRLALGGAVVVALLCWPVWEGLRYVVEFHAARPGGGMSWQNVLSAFAWNDPVRNLGLERSFLFPAWSALLFPLALLVACLASWLRRLDLFEGTLVLALTFLAASKLVNEVYPLTALALAVIVVFRRPSPSLRWLVHLLWVMPLVFAMVNVPIWGFLLPPAEALGLVSLDDLRQFRVGYVLTYQHLSAAFVVVGVVFQAVCAWGVWLVLRGRSTSPEGASATGTGVRAGA